MNANGAVFLAAQARGAHRMVPPELFRSCIVTVAVLVGFAFVVGYYGLPFVMSLYMEQLRGPYRRAVPSGGEG
jgi:MFS transporter, DHA2 family, methylenomycin A resistance protein